MARPWTRAARRGKHLTKKRTLKKVLENVFFRDFVNIKKMRDARTIIFHQVSRRDICYVSENKGFRFTFFVSRKQTGWGPIGKTVPSWMGSLVL